MALVGFVLLVIVLLVIGLVSGSGSSKRSSGNSAAAKKAKHRTHGGGSAATTTAGAGTQSPLVALSLHPTATVYVCLIGDRGRKLIPGVELHAGATTPTFHAQHYEITLGNSSVIMLIDGQARTVPPSSQAIGYSITKAAGRRPLHLGQLPTCV
jgi:hypothetical protein